MRRTPPGVQEGLDAYPTTGGWERDMAKVQSSMPAHTHTRGPLVALALAARTLINSVSKDYNEEWSVALLQMDAPIQSNGSVLK